uniref:Radical SAM protein n=1 Tax=candidate division WOR-3 bacterium TaxID=2052148 RepID=A0A7C4U7T8_UNCW3
MRIISKYGKDEIAFVYVADINGKIIEFVESVQPPIPREEKWVIIVSTLFGCPVKCPICDAGGNYKGRLSRNEIFAQIEFIIKQRYNGMKIPVERFKIQFSRIGEPSFNRNVLSVIDEIKDIIEAQNIIPSISTIAPVGTENFFKQLLDIKKKKFNKDFQLQFSIHSTDKKARDYLIPVKKWDFERIKEYGEEFYNGGKKITLNFALSQFPIDAREMIKYFSPEIFIIKITPVNPTYNATRNNFNILLPSNYDERIISLKEEGYEVILSIGELEENNIGSNCGQFAYKYKEFYNGNGIK